MSSSIKELRDSTGLTQKAFADLFGIPISTLRKWEQGENSPAGYIVHMIARLLPRESTTNKKYTDDNGREYYYNRNARVLSDSIGNSIIISEDLDGVKPENLPLYIKDLFDEFYDIQEKFNTDCKLDKQEDIIWS